MRGAANQRAQRANRPTRGLPGAPKRRGAPEWLTQPFTLGVIALAVVLLGIVVFLGLTSGGKNIETKELEASRAALPLDLANGAKLGKDDAPLKITMYEDFQCDFCVRFTAGQEPNIIEKFVKTGKVQLIFAHLPVEGAESVTAARAAVCAADQNKFWQYANRLFLVQARAGQTKVEKTQVGRFSQANLRKYAIEEGLDPAKYDQCLADPASLATVTTQTTEASQLGLRATPSFLFNGQSIGSGALVDNAAWESAINSYLNATPTPAASASPSGSATPAAAGTAAATTAPQPTATP
ncbi:MAG: thioredoxin domain-containing protein [Chloroflexi bacterium]|nr:thioredoxin domain-containing protein [Chloroflexota bacterium]